MADRRVVITGIGIVSPLGDNREDSWRAALLGHSGAAPISQFNASSWPTRIACEVKDTFALAEAAVREDQLESLSRPSRFGCEAAWEAMLDSGLDGQVDPLFFGVCVGANIGALPPQVVASFLRGDGRPSSVSAGMLLRNHPGTLAAALSARWNTQGPLTTIQTACASSGQALGHAYRQIKRGECDAVLAGGADSLASELLLAGFCLLGALSTRNEDPTKASRPFDKDRDGFVAGEGAAMLVLEELELAKARGAQIYAEIAGYGETESAYRITDLPPNGRGIVEAMHEAVRQSGMDHADVGYVNAHGTSTELNDRIEAVAVQRVFGSRGALPMVSSTKSMTGHLISAAGALELAFATMAVRYGEVPPTINLEQTDCGEDIDFVAHHSKKASLKAALSNSIGFGGSNSSILVRRVEE